MDAAGDHTSIVNVEIQIIQNLVISRYFSAAGLTLLFYDTVLTMEAEARLVWPGPFQIPKLLYYINRYWSIVSLIAANYLVAGFRPPLSTTPSTIILTFVRSCQVWVFAGAIAELIAEVSSSAILVLRVAALYERHRWMVRGLWITYGLLYAISIGLGVLAVKSFYRNFVYDTLTGVCMPVEASHSSYEMFVIPIAFDAIIVSLTMIKTYRLAATVRKESGGVILYTMLWDGILYFITIVALRVFNTVVWAILPNSFIYLGIYTYWALISTLTSRLFLNLRAAAYNQPSYVRNQSIAPVYPGGEQGNPSKQWVTERTNLDTTLSVTLSRVERSAYTEFGHKLEAQLLENRDGSEMELQPRDKASILALDDM